MNEQPDDTTGGAGEGQGSRDGRHSEAGGAGGPFGSYTAPLAGLRQEMDRLFDDFFANPALSGLRRRSMDSDPWRRFQSMFDATSPVVDVVEQDDAYRIVAELPGIAQQDLDIAVVGGILTIKGEKRQEKSESKENYHVSERRYGAFQRSFPLPEVADPDSIEADLARGVLTIAVRKRANTAASPRKIQIKTT